MIRKHMTSENTYRDDKMYSTRNKNQTKLIDTRYVHLHLHWYTTGTRWQMCFHMSYIFVSSILFWFPQRTCYFWRVFCFLFLERKQESKVISVKNVQGCFTLIHHRYSMAAPLFVTISPRVIWAITCFEVSLL
jgi:hypothetical protein